MISSTTCRLFLPTELATAEELLESGGDIERFSYEYLTMYKLLEKNQVLNLQLMKKAMSFMIQRHPNFLAYYVKNSDGSIERKYNHHDGTVFIEIDTIKEAEIKSYIKERRKLETFTSIPNQRYYFAKTEQNYYIMSYSHHAFKDVLIDQTIVEELVSIYYFLVKEPSASFDQATSHLPKIATYAEVLEDFYRVNQQKLKELVVFLRSRFQNVMIPIDSPLNQNTTLCKANKVRCIFYDSPAILQKKFKPNICLMTLTLISLQKLFNIQGALPIWKLNGSRPKVAEGVLCSYIKDQVFVHPLNQKNTFRAQYEQNYCNNRESLILFNECDYSEALQVLSEQLEKDCLPKVCFNFYKVNEFNKHVYAYKQLSDEYDVVNSIMNIYFDMIFDSKANEYSITAFYKKAIFQDQIIRQVMEFINLGYKYLHLISEVRIEQINLEYLRTLDNLSMKKLQIAKPKL